MSRSTTVDLAPVISSDSSGERQVPHGTLSAAAHPLRKGDRGPLVRTVRGLLARVAALTPQARASAGPGEEDLFDDALDQAVRAFQQDRGLVADGIVGRQTAVQLDAARWRLGERVMLLTPGGHWMRGDDVSALQERMVVLGVHAGPVDAIFGPHTQASLRELQRGLGLPADGICGPRTFDALGALGRSVAGGDAWGLRSRARVAMAGASLAGKTIAVDPGSGGESSIESGINDDVAARLAGGLRSVGATVVLTRAATEVAEIADRAAVAESAAADLVISFLCESVDSPQASGVATYYWGGGRVGQRSASGQRLATLIQREIVARTDLVDCRSHPCSFELVRITRMPVVMVSLGYLSNPGDAQRLSEGGFRELLAEAVLFAVQRLYLGEEDARTGTLNLSDVQALARRR